MESFQAFVVEQNGEKVTSGIQTLRRNELPEGQVLVRVHYSGLNYKDALACIKGGGVIRSYPMIPGIDLAGTVLESQDSRFRQGDKVLATGYDLGVAHYGGWSQLARVPADWLIPIPQGWTEKEAMIVGTAGFTAALAVKRLEENGLQPDRGSVLVTGATGGAGSMAVALLARRGYRVVASTGKDESEFLRSIGAAEILPREDLLPKTIRPLEKQKWAGAIDCVGGQTLAYVLASIQYDGSVAAIGLAQSSQLPTTVMPFILRGVNLLGINSVLVPRSVREKLWPEMARDLDSGFLNGFVHAEVELSDMPRYVELILQGQIRGRVLVNLL